ncbi:acyl-CoA dehydrogenase family protein [Sphaerisporangium sp. NPDC051017]|uniref:acyl-CoA dehydrogenase family protein n=1 Tax=Sphaerisporangium sp. NPDC051017 TaxID=3154636 RepID=UPI00344A32E9
MREVFDADHAAFAESFRAFVERETREPDAFHRAGKAGLLGMQVPEHHGGGGVDDPRFCAVAIEELVRAGQVGFALAYADHVGVGQTLLADHASIEQRDDWLPVLAAGDTTVAVAVDPVTGQATAGEVTLHGVCRSVVNGARAGVALIPVHVDDRGVAVAIVALPGNGIRRTDVDGLAVAEAALADLEFDGVRISESNLIIGSALQHLRTDIHLWTAVISLAGAHTALDWTWSYVRDRKVFGRPVASFENTRLTLGGLSAEITSAQAYLDRCLLRHGAHRLRPEEAAAAKLVGTELFGRAADQGLQLHGGYGYMREYPISTLFADARFLRWYGGSNEDLRLEITGTMDQ